MDPFLNVQQQLMNVHESLVDCNSWSQEVHLHAHQHLFRGIIRIIIHAAHLLLLEER